MKYVAITQHGKYFFCDPPGLLYHGAPGVGPTTIFERVELGDDKVAFRTLKGFYVRSAAGKDDLAAVSDERGPEQTFVEVWLPDDRIGLQTHEGKFVGVTDEVPNVLAVATVMGDKEKFFYEKPPDELLPKAEAEMPHATIAGVARPAPKPRLRDALLRPFRRGS